MKNFPRNPEVNFVVERIDGNNPSCTVHFHAAWATPFDCIDENFVEDNSLKVEIEAADAIAVLELLVKLHPENEELQRWLDFGKDGLQYCL